MSSTHKNDLLAHAREADRTRIERIRRWHVDHAIAAEDVAALHFSITAKGDVSITALAIEPEHAAILIPELLEMSRQLRDFAETLKKPGDVVPFRRS